MEHILRIDSATKRFDAPEGGTVVALDNVSLNVARNEFITLLGPSGCGKTTLLRAVSGFEDLDAGEIYIDGQAVTGRPAHRRPVNTVFQRYALFPHLSVARNVSYSLDVAGMDKAVIRERVGKMLELVGLAGLGERKIGQLSGGQQQRVALARSLVAQPKILLLDEPLSALDKNLRHKMQQELKTLQHELGISFVFVTHDQEEALVMSDRIAVLNDGKIQQLDGPEALYHRPRNEFVARFIGESNLLPGDVETVSGGMATVALPDRSRLELPSGDVAAGDRVKVLFRPENVTASQDGGGRGLSLSGTVQARYFVGTDYQLTVAAAGLPQVKATLRNQGAGRMLETGDAIELFVPFDAMHLVLAQGGTA